MSGETLILGLNPAWQRLFILDKLKLGEVRRMPKAAEYASGKGINCARILRLLGGNSLLSHFLGTGYGNKIFDEIAASGIKQVPVWIESPTRICTTIVTDDDITELIEPSPELSEREMDDFCTGLNEVWQGISNVALCGSQPTGFNMDALVNFDFTGKKLYVDAFKDVQNLLEKGVELLKINKLEYCKLLSHFSIPQVTSSPQFWKMSASLLLERLPIKHLVVTDEENPVRLFFSLENKFQCYSVAPPEIEIVNCIGAGDSFLAAWIYADSVGATVEERLAKATAVAVARCEAEQPWDLDLAHAEEFERDLLKKIEKEA